VSIVILVLFGIAVGFLARRIMPSPVPGGLVTDCIVGLVGALLGAWIARTVFHVRISGAIASPSTWISGILGAVLLLLAVRVVLGASGGSHHRPRMPRLHR
jgi:uncharacterized membrane protein YeaQ/YmgE (transglycosylase-associated protein family)